jgi:hypothetical protein
MTYGIWHRDGMGMGMGIWVYGYGFNRDVSIWHIA